MSRAGDDGRAPAGAALDNPVWHALTTAHSHLAEHHDGARRYQRDITVFSAVDALDERAWSSLAVLAGPGHGVVLLRDVIGPPPERWEPLFADVLLQMVAEPPTRPTRPIPPIPEVDLRPLTTEDVPQMVELVRISQPGPFLSRTIELGGYAGAVDGDRLLAMAGERLRLPGFAEVSAVCTHPDARGRGLATALTAHIATAIAHRGETPFLHVAMSNVAAQSVYQRLGFRVRRGMDVAALRAPELVH